MRIVQLFAALTLVLALAFAALAQDGPLAREVLAKERQELDTLKSGDYDQFASLLADDAMFVDAHGPATKEVVVSNTKEFRLQDYTIENPKFVRVSKDSLMLIYKITESGISHGHSFSATVYASALWAKRNGKWLCLFSQETAAH